MTTVFSLLAVAALVVFIIGMVKPQLVVFWSKKKSRGMACLYLVVMVMCFFFVGATSSVANVSSTNSNSSSTVSTSTKPNKTISKASSAAPATVKVNETLSSGFYTVGTDIPSGTYNFKAVKGGGNVTTEDGSINEIMGVKGKGSEYTPTFNNADLEDGTVLSISSVTLQITSDDANGSTLAKRSQNIKKSFKFSAGNYKSGKDFPTGTYDIAAVSGSGNVTTDDGSLNAIMGTSGDDMYEKSYSNVDLSDGKTLQITGVTVSLTPSK